MKAIYQTICAICIACGLWACSDVDLPESASNNVGTITDLVAEYEQGSRQVTLRWTNPQGVTGIQIIKDNIDVLDFDEPMTSYFIKKAPTNVDVAYTVKARFADGVLSNGTTVRFNIAYEKKKGGNVVAMLVADDYTASDDEKDAVAWFQQNYVATGKGVLLTPVILLLILLILLVVLLVFLLLLVMGLLGLLTCLLHKFFQLFDLLFHLLGLLAVGQKNLLVANNGGICNGGTHAFAVKVFGETELGQSLLDGLFGGIEVLRLELVGGVLQAAAGVEVGNDADILVR